MAKLSTHVLDTSRGQPAANLRIDLYRAGKLVKTVTTNADGRTSEPLLSGDRVPAGIYELVFHAGDYFRGLGDRLAVPPFLYEVVVPFCIAAETGPYNVPLLL